MKNLIILIYSFVITFSFNLKAQEVEIDKRFGSSLILMTPDPSGGGNTIEMENTGDADRSWWRLIYEKNNLAPPQGPIEFAWELGTGFRPGVAQDFFSIGRYDFNVDFIFVQTGLVMDNQTLFTGIGELTPNARLHVFNDDNVGNSQIPAALIGEFQGSGFGYLTVDQPSTDDNVNIARFRDDGLTKVWINRGSEDYQLTVFGDALASGGLWVNSDRKLKTNIREFKSGLSGIRQLKPSTYYFKRAGDENQHLPEEYQFGLVAQDLQKVYPNLVRESDRLTEEGEILDKIQSVNYNGLIPVLIASVQELDQNLNDKSAEVKTLKLEIAQLQERLNRLEKQMIGEK